MSAWLRSLLGVLALLSMATGCAVQPTTEDPRPPVGGNQPGSQTVNYLPVDSVFPNPERGFHDHVELTELQPGSNIHVSTADISLVRGYVHLDDYRYEPLPDWFLASLHSGFAAVRANGLKVVPRFVYNFNDGPDAPLDHVLEHIAQLEPVLRENGDVIAVLQAGFIGKWGEWHGSDEGLTDPASKQQIGQALLAALPADRMVQIRAPFHIQDVLGHENMLSAGEAFSGNSQSRLGLVNDCFLSGLDDVGTFPTEFDEEYTQAHTRFTTTGGETCDHPEEANRQSCENALRELELYHWDYLNLGFYRLVLDAWRDDGCFTEISRRLGYRFELESATLTTFADRPPELELRVSNSGFGKLYNPRPLEVVLINRATGAEVVHVITEDARQVLPLAGQENVSITTSLPDRMASGVWDLQLWLPDADSRLRGDSAYSIRLASAHPDFGSLWLGASGRNRLGLSLTLPVN